MDDGVDSPQANDGPAGARPSRRRAATSPRRVSFVGVLGEVLLTVGALVLLYVGWQLWIGDVIYGAEREAQADEQSRIWQEQYERSAPPTQGQAPAQTPEATPDSPASDAPADPVILPEADDAEVFATLLIPRFGPDYHVSVAGGVSRARTLDPIGVGHYPGTQMPGEIGNVGLAAHRTTWGKPFNRIADLHVGDAIVLETKDGWYTYRFRTLEYVQPSAVEVLAPVPQQDGLAADGRYLTMTSCSPMYSQAERIIAYSVFDSFTPRSAGPPSSLSGSA